MHEIRWMCTCVLLELMTVEQRRRKVLMSGHHKDLIYMAKSNSYREILKSGGHGPLSTPLSLTYAMVLCMWKNLATYINMCSYMAKYICIYGMHVSSNHSVSYKLAGYLMITHDQITVPIRAAERTFGAQGMFWKWGSACVCYTHCEFHYAFIFMTMHEF